MDRKQKTDRKSGFYDLLIWQKAMACVHEIYAVARQLPKEEQFALASQLRRAGVSIPSNIAEGSKKGSKEFLQFLRTASGSAAELETQLILAQELYGIDVTRAMPLLLETQRMLEAFMRKMRA